MSEELFKAVEQCNAQELKRALEQGADVNTQNKFRETPLHIACALGCLDCATLLLERGAGANALDNLGLTPLLHASAEGCPELVSLLLDHGANIEHREYVCNMNALHTAAQADNASVVSQLIQLGLAVDDPDQSGWTSLHNAVRFGCQASAEILLENGASLMVRNNRGWTALDIARNAIGLDEVDTVMVGLLERYRKS